MGVLLRAAAAPVLLALASAACADGCDEPGSASSSSSPSRSDPLPSDPIERALALRDRAPQGTPSWPEGTRILGGDRVFDLAVQRGGDLYAAAQEEIVRVPTAGGAPATLARFPGRETRAMALTARHLLVATHERSPDGVGVKGNTGKLVALALDGPEAGAALELRNGFDASTEIAASDDGVYWMAGTEPPAIVYFRAPAFKGERVTLRDDHVMFWGAVAEHEGLEWLEDDVSTTTKRLMTWTRGPGDAAAPVRQLAQVDGLGSTMRGDGHALYLITTKSRSATAPGGGTYYEDSGGVLAIDRATGATTELATGHENPGDLAVGPAWVCMTVYGPKLSFSKNSSVYAVPKSGGPERRLATGLQRPSCLAADDGAFYVREQGKPGIARVPVPAAP